VCACPQLCQRVSASRETESATDRLGTLPRCYATVAARNRGRAAAHPRACWRSGRRGMAAARRHFVRCRSAAHGLKLLIDGRSEHRRLREDLAIRMLDARGGYSPLCGPLPTCSSTPGRRRVDAPEAGFCGQIHARGCDCARPRELLLRRRKIRVAAGTRGGVATRAARGAPPGLGARRRATYRLDEPQPARRSLAQCAIAASSTLRTRCSSPDRSRPLHDPAREHHERAASRSR